MNLFSADIIIMENSFKKFELTRVVLNFETLRWHVVSAKVNKNANLGYSHD